MTENQEFLYINKYLSEEGNYLTSQFQRHKRIAIWSPMNTGKTTFTINDVYKYCEANKFKQIIIIPTTAQLDQLNQRDTANKLEAQYSFYKAKESAQAVITTPDSLPKIIEHCDKLQQPFVLCVDEGHELETSYTYRKAFKNILIALDNYLCKNVICFSGTLDNLIVSDTIKFDKLFVVDVKKKFINANTFKITKVKKMNLETMAMIIKDKLKQYGQVLFKVDSVEKLKELTKMLDKHKVTKKVQPSLLEDIEDKVIATIEETDKTIYLSSQNRDYNPINQNIVNDIAISEEYKLIGFTSLVNSGIEIKASPKIAVINFTNDTFIFLNEIQFIGRLRLGVEEYCLVIKEPIKKQSNLYNYETIRQSVVDYANDTLENENKIYNKYNKTFYSIESARLEARSINKPFLFFNEDKDCFEIDNISLNAYCYKVYINQYLNHPEALLTKFKNHPSFNANKYVIEEFKGKDLEAKQLANGIKESKKKQCEEDKKELQKSMEYISHNLSDKEIELLLDNQIEIEYEENKELKENLTIWQDLKENKEKQIYSLIRCIKGIGKAKAFKIVTFKNDLELKNILECANIVLLNNIYDSNPSDLDFRKNKRHYKLKLTRDLIEKDKKKLNGIRITEKLQQELFDLYIEKGFVKQRKFTKANKQALVKYLNQIYILKKYYEEKQHFVISSVSKNIDCLISITSTE